MKGVVYILTNESMGDYVKIGKTSDLEQRMRKLDSTSIPLPFECFYAAEVEDMDFVEKQLHQAYADRRTRSTREFFEVAPELVSAALRMVELKDVTPQKLYVESKEDEVAITNKKHRTAYFNFEMVAIPVGSVLTFTRDSSVTCEVVDHKSVRFNGRVTSLSEAALSTLHDMGYAWKTVRGPLFWEYEGETLLERRKRMEES